MPQPTIDVSFVEEFESGVHMAYQRMGSRFRSTVRRRDNVKNKTTFQKVGKGAATQKARHGQVPPMNLPHDKVAVTVEDWFAGEWVDDLDMLRQNQDEMVIAQESGAAALGRKTDDLIITAMSASTTTLDETTNGVTIAWALSLMELFGNNDVPDDGQRWCGLAWENWSQLMQIPEFKSSDFIGAAELPFKVPTTAKSWMSFIWFPFSGFTDTGANRECYGYHRSAVGHAIGADVQTNMQYYNTHDSWFALNKMQMNAVTIDVNGVAKCTLKK